MTQDALYFNPIVSLLFCKSQILCVINPKNVVSDKGKVKWLASPANIGLAFPCTLRELLTHQSFMMSRLFLIQA